MTTLTLTSPNATTRITAEASPFRHQRRTHVRLTWSHVVPTFGDCERSQILPVVQAARELAALKVAGWTVA